MVGNNPKLIEKIVCSIFGHNFHVVDLREWLENEHKTTKRCSRCGSYWKPKKLREMLPDEK
jgi:hypothetical protein